MGAIYILPKPGERELPDWAKRHNDEQREREAQAEADKRSQDNWGYKR